MLQGLPGCEFRYLNVGAWGEHISAGPGAPYLLKAPAAQTKCREV